MNSTITAIITPPGKSAVAGIRISGPKAFSIANKLLAKDVFALCSHKACYTKLIEQKSGKVLDQVLFITMHSPNSYTGEDVIEIFCHGSPVITNQILQEIVQLGGLLAKPGEFTLRAFKNGKMDLMQAEAVQTLIASESIGAASCAKQHLEGHLSETITKWQKQLTDIAATVIAAIDFPEEDLTFSTKKTLLQQLTEIKNQMQKLCSSFEDGRKLQEGVSFCLLGPPNAGKSSLLNALLRKNRAIVTDTAGTTRDLLQEQYTFGSHHFCLIDTAGIRETNCAIETKGITLAKQAAKQADFTLFVVGANMPLAQVEKQSQLQDPKKTIFVWNKADLARPCFHPNFPNQLHVSAKTGEGLEELQKLFVKMSLNNPLESYPFVLTQKRHKLCLEEAIKYIEKTCTGLEENKSFEFLGVDLQEALEALSKMIGTCVTEDILSSIFSQFCVGK